MLCDDWTTHILTLSRVKIFTTVSVIWKMNSSGFWYFYVCYVCVFFFFIFPRFCLYISFCVIHTHYFSRYVSFLLLYKLFYYVWPYFHFLSIFCHSAILLLIVLFNVRFQRCYFHWTIEIKKKKKNLTTISLHHGIMNSGSKKCFFFIYFLFVANLLAIYLIWTHTIGFSIYSFRCHSLFFFFFIRFEFEEMVYVCRLNFGLATEWLGWEIWDFYFALRNVDRVIAF